MSKRILFFLLIISIINSINSFLRFNIPNNRDKCFLEELFVEGTVLIKYHLYGLEEAFKKESQSEILRNIKIFIKNSKGKVIHETFLSKIRDKYAIHLTEPDQYFVCARFYKSWSKTDLPESVQLVIKIRSDYDYKELDKSLQKEDVQNFETRIKEIISETVPSIESAKKELVEEDNTAKDIIGCSNAYYKLTIVQLIIIFIISFYNIINFKNFLSSKRVI